MNDDQKQTKPKPKSRKHNLDREGALKPDINVKVDELFIRWFNLPSTQKALKEGLRQIRQQKPAKTFAVVKETPNLDAAQEVSEAVVETTAKTQHNNAVSSATKPATNIDKPLLSPRRKQEGKNKLSPVKTPGSTRSTPSREKTSGKDESNAKIPRFYFPCGRPKTAEDLKSTLTKISEAFTKLGKDRLTQKELGAISTACGYTDYWKSIFFKASSKPNSSTVTKSDVLSMWTRVGRSNHDDASRFIRMLAKPGKSYLEFDDFQCLMQDVVETHPGLTFLREAPEFHTRYMNTVIARIFYVVNRSWSGHITVSELRKSNFLSVLNSLDDEDDINVITDYFSYEHFYVVYCKFWELDTDHDLVIDKQDLLRHASGALSSRLIDRALCGAVTRWDTSDHRAGKMSYIDFVWFLISEEDKKSHTSIEYWFRCMDLDGDGAISMYEMEYFYEEQMRKLEQLDIEPLPFEDCVCQMLDMVMPSNRNQVNLRDLKNCKMAHVFFDTFFNVEKYLDHEQKDPFAPQKDIDSHLPEPSDWEKFAAEEYEILVAEEQADEQDSFGTHYREDVDPLIEEELRNLAISSGMVGLGQREVEVKSDNFRKSPILSEMDSPDASAHRRLLT